MTSRTSGTSRRGFLRGRLGAGAPAPPPPSAPGDVLAEAQDVTVRLGAREVLHGVCVAARAGEVLALVGPNGAGKSTLLGALAADLPVDGGVVRVHGRPVGEWSASELALRRAVLPQSAALSFPFTVEEVVRMGRAPWARQPGMYDEDDASVAEAMAVTEVTGFAARPFSALSGGERARVALARVLAQRAPLLMLDEPTAALDLRHQELVLRVCRERARAGDAVVVVLHDLGLAAAYADRVAVLRDGRVAADGPPAGVFEEALLSEVYRQPVEVFRHPRTGDVLITPKRGF
ncbi:heme ABC transporter ATP-binding protein [Streptomyces europaeiscabiei]|uniref:Heme ABC transporter ATP-binding protein n=1 Tax=Streptomyces europaeiscabiei TaxID=146819 RepID=A0ABU4N9B7_9ACTN|nr:heme ABC transporter ATP-binding protein [Streptomyces europaeiscabiei]MDX2524137.1 heme ABC transporter ATP-binding protein [Streptomyces europaeiscabiei]MDX2763220.1 heme ABC transporter ATP-binding protein [Streptomyces europaeiscabiei]MDX2772976.1 heme ABC transporter ATP-binding protein [Streptomyces europaeiscabiei]MDX3545402.1 heme ABC transporter ATP-binding protein [Streptomyces europaeiscabiei]MDX3554393.1 heme ABC transporter ATP-binding protein [Streptomyces europaeiscabiei]